MELAKYMDAEKLADGTRYSEVKGSAYETEEYLPGVLLTNTDVEFEIPLRYNIYLDQMQFIRDDKGYTVTTAVKEANFGNRKYISLYHLSRLGFYEEIHKTDRVQVLKKHKKMYKPQSEAEGYRDPEPARFIDDKPVYFLLIDAVNLIELRGKKEIQNSFDDKIILGYIKGKKLNFKKDEDAIKLADFITDENLMTSAE